LRELALHILDIAENSVSANAKNVCITVQEDTRSDRLEIRIEDDGHGMDAAMVKSVVDPFTTSRTTRKVGLGIPLLKAAAEACDGSLTIQSQPGIGTQVDVSFRRSHIDRMPLGDLAATQLTLLVGSPEVHWIFRYRFNDEEFEFDDELVKEELADILLSDPTVLRYLRESLQDGIRSAKQVAA